VAEAGLYSPSLEPFKHFTAFFTALDFRLTAVLSGFPSEDAELINELLELTLIHIERPTVLRAIYEAVAMNTGFIQVPDVIESRATFAQVPAHQRELRGLDADMSIAYIYVRILVICGVVMSFALDAVVGADAPFDSNAVVLRSSSQSEVVGSHFVVPLSFILHTHYTPILSGCQPLWNYFIK